MVKKTTKRWQSLEENNGVISGSSPTQRESAAIEGREKGTKTSMKRIEKKIKYNSEIVGISVQSDPCVCANTECQLLLSKLNGTPRKN